MISKLKNKSIINKLTYNNLISNDLLVLISNLTLEDLIAIKLELACANLKYRLYGLDIWRRSDYIVKEALLKFAISTSKSKIDAARFLGLTYSEFSAQYDKYDIDNFFIEEDTGNT